MDVGQRLFEARRRRGLTLDDISRTTKIPVSVLYAIERNDERHLPQKFFTRAFIRAYASEVGLDANDLLENDELDSAEPLALPYTPVEDQAPSSRSFIVAAALAVLTIYYGYALQRTPAHVPGVADAATMQQTDVVAPDTRGDIALQVSEAVTVEPAVKPQATLANVRVEIPDVSAASSDTVPVAIIGSTDSSAEVLGETVPVEAHAAPVISDAILPQPDIPAPVEF